VDRIKEILGRLDRWSQGHRFPRVSRRAVTGFMEHEAPQFAGTMAYYAVLSVFQLVVLGVVIFSLFLGEGEARDFVIEQVEAGTPIEGDLVADIIDGVIRARGGITLFGAVFLAWGALGLFSAMQNGINRAFPSAEKRPFVKDKVLGLLLIGLTGVLAVASVLIGIVTGIVIRVVADLAELVPGGAFLLTGVNLLVPLLLMFAAFMVIYRVVPNRPVAFAEVWPGALVAAVLWTVLRLGFTYYATNVANYDTAFGPISTGITLLVFFYFASLVVLLGAEFARANVVDDEQARQASQPSAGQPAAAQLVAGRTAVAPRQRRGIAGWFLVAAAGIIGLVLGRKSRRPD
jgi:membrane protein